MSAMSLQPLTIIMLLCYLMLLAASLMVWFALTMHRAPQTRKEAARSAKKQVEPSKPQLASPRETARPEQGRAASEHVASERATTGRPTEPRRPAAATASTSTTPTPPRPNNDQVRGAWAADNRKANASEGDPFERFIRSKNDDMSF